MKRNMIIIVIAALIFTLSACGTTENNGQSEHSFVDIKETSLSSIAYMYSEDERDSFVEDYIQQHFEEYSHPDRFVGNKLWDMYIYGYVVGYLSCQTGQDSLWWELPVLEENSAFWDYSGDSDLNLIFDAADAPEDYISTGVRP